MFTSQNIKLSISLHKNVYLQLSHIEMYIFKKAQFFRLHLEFLKYVSAEKRLGVAVASLIANIWTECDSMRDDKTQVVFGEIRWAFGAHSGRRAWHAGQTYSTYKRAKNASCAAPRPWSFQNTSVKIIVMCFSCGDVTFLVWQKVKKQNITKNLQISLLPPCSRRFTNQPKEASWTASDGKWKRACCCKNNTHLPAFTTHSSHILCLLDMWHFKMPL